MKNISFYLLFILLVTTGCVKVTIEKDSEDKGLVENLFNKDKDSSLDGSQVNTPPPVIDNQENKNQIKDDAVANQEGQIDQQNSQVNNTPPVDQVNSNNNNQENMQEQNQDPAADLKYNPYKFEDLASKFSQALIKTNKGDIKVAFYKESPFTVNNFLNLAKLDYYTDTTFHRVIKDFMIQGGDINSKDDDPTNDGMGGPGYYFQDEFNDHKLVAGSLAMANAGPNSNGSQFFIVTAEAVEWLDGKHTNFGHVIEGMEIVREIEAVEVGEADRPTEAIKVVGVELIEGSDDEIVEDIKESEETIE